MIVRVDVLSVCHIHMRLTGEILEKATRVLTDEEKALLETEFVGKNGQRRKLEVCYICAHPDGY